MKLLKICLSICLSLQVLHISSLCSTAEKKIRNVKIIGYVTNINSPTVFEIEDYKITHDDSTSFEFENKKKNEAIPFKELRIGTFVEVKALYNQESGEIKANKIKVDLEQFRTLKQTALLSRSPQGLRQTVDGWEGIFFADGRRIIVNPSTKVIYKLNKSEKKIVEKSKQKEVDIENAYDIKPLQSLAEVGPGTIMEYEGKQQADGSILAEQVSFMRNEKEKDEQSLWNQIAFTENAANFTFNNPGDLIVAGSKYKILPNKEVQEYVSGICQNLIPEYQKALPNNDPQKIPFHFVVVMDKSFNASAYANGLVVVHTGLFDTLENEAQLAAVLGHEIAHAIQEHSYRQMQYHRKKMIAMTLGSIFAGAMGYDEVATAFTMVTSAIRSGYSRRLEDQADRIGLEYLVRAGYDPREAPKVWKLVSQKYGDGPTTFWSSHPNNAERRSYLMLEIKHNYAELDLGKMKTNKEQFKAIAAKVQ
jgi:hypothetical protein